MSRKPRHIFTLADAERERHLAEINAPAFIAAERQAAEQARRAILLRENPEIGVLNSGSAYMFEEGVEIRGTVENLAALLAPKRQAEAQAIQAAAS